MLRRKAIVFLFAALMAWPVTYLIFRGRGNWEFVRVPGREYWIDHAADGFAGGSGGSGDPYVIETAEQLALVAKRVNGGGAREGHFHISKDVDLSGRDWVPIGTRENPFSGHLESTGAVVSNLTIRGDRDGQGLVGVMEHGMLASVTLESVDVEGRDRVGGLVGVGDYIVIGSCGVSGSVRGRDRIGGLAGDTNWSFCVDGFYRGEVAGREEVGGLIGRWAKESGKWSGCEGRMARVSFCGNIWGSALERGSGVVGRVTGTNCVGGLIGYMAAKGRSILNGFFTGRVADERHGSTVAVVGGGGSILDWDYRENFPYDLVWSKPGAWIFLREDTLFVRIRGEKGTVKEVRVPVREGPAVLHAVVSGQVPEGLTSSDRVRYIEMKRASGIPELAFSDIGGPVGWHGVRFFISMYSGMDVDNVKLPIDENCENLFVPRGLYCIPCVKFLDDDTLDVTWILIRVV